VLEGANHPLLEGQSRGLRMMGLNLALTGGRLAGLLFDIRIRQRSHGAKSLDTLWADSVDRLGRDGPYGREQFLQFVAETTPLKDPGGRLASAPLELEKTFAAAGLHIKTTTTTEPALNVYFDVNSTTPEIKWVMPGAAQKAGLVRGDTILSVTTRTMRTIPVPDLRLFDYCLRKSKPGDLMDLSVRSASGETRTVHVRLGARTRQTVERVPAPTAEQDHLWHGIISESDD